MATTPNWTSTPKTGVVSISTANTALDGTGTIGTVFTAGASGSRIEEIVIKASAATTAGMVRLFIHDGSTYYLFKEVDITAATPSGTVKAFRYDLDLRGTPIFLPANYSLRASTNNAETFKVFAFGGDF